MSEYLIAHCYYSEQGIFVKQLLHEILLIV